MTPQEKYDKQNTRFIGLKLNRKSDKDILDALEGKALQTEIKRLLRKALESEKEEKEWKKCGMSFWHTAFFYSSCFTDFRNLLYTVHPV